MSDDPVVATTDGMTGGGYYDEHSEYQEKVAESGSGLVRACVDAVPLPGPGETFVVADYGASTGKNSIAAVRNAIDQVRTRAGPTNRRSRCTTTCRRTTGTSSSRTCRHRPTATCSSPGRP